MNSSVKGVLIGFGGLVVMAGMLFYSIPTVQAEIAVDDGTDPAIAEQPADEEEIAVSEEEPSGGELFPEEDGTQITEATEETVVEETNDTEIAAGDDGTDATDGGTGSDEIAGADETTDEIDGGAGSDEIAGDEETTDETLAEDANDIEVSDIPADFAPDNDGNGVPDDGEYTVTINGQDMTANIFTVDAFGVTILDFGDVEFHWANGGWAEGNGFVVQEVELQTRDADLEEPLGQWEDAISAYEMLSSAVEDMGNFFETAEEEPFNTALLTFTFPVVDIDQMQDNLNELLELDGQVQAAYQNLATLDREPTDEELAAFNELVDANISLAQPYLDSLNNMIPDAISGFEILLADIDAELEILAQMNNDQGDAIALLNSLRDTVEDLMNTLIGSLS